ncbi:MAG: hypothetical protein K2N48_00155 [Muribaculaceae bacterium]|nr:hypothetical protein [Muribaculaceae bacterium]
MRRLHVISHPEHEMGGEIYYRESEFMHNPELHRAYKCGVKQGWREAMEEVDRGEYAERHHYSRGSMPPMYREEHPMHHETPMYRGSEGWREPEDDEIVYRRRRAANGRYM